MVCRLRVDEAWALATLTQLKAPACTGHVSGPLKLTPKRLVDNGNTSHALRLAALLQPSGETEAWHDAVLS